MADLRDNISHVTVELQQASYRKMLGLVKLLDRLWQDSCYRTQVYAEIPEVARFDPGHAAVMMCYDFHLSGGEPRLIEVNTNAGGGLLACLACDPNMSAHKPVLPARLQQQLLDMFSLEIRRFSTGIKDKPGQIVIIDEDPQQQHLYPEMCVFAELLRSWGVPTSIVDPKELDTSTGTVLLAGQPVDLIYNRHCDFYLESGAMAGIRAAYLAGKVCLTPNPHMYALLADKRRLTLWSSRELSEKCVMTEDERSVLDRIVPKANLLSDLDPESLWPARKKYVFKPVDSFGSRGVLLGEKITRKRFNELPPEKTLVQELVPPSMTEVSGYGPMKTDFRLYAYRDKIFGLTARLYRGQVTNLRTEGGGFACVKVV